MRQRLIPKPARLKTATRFSRLSEGFRRNESIIIALSALFSSVGLLIASTSTWIAWKQIEILSEDRENPFKAALFEQKVASMNETLGAIASYQTATTCLQSTQSTEKIYGFNAENRRACIQNLDAPSQELVLSIKRAFALWPPRTQKFLVAYMNAALEQNACASIVLLMHGQEERYNLNKPPGCDDEFMSVFPKMNEIEFKLRREMANELSKSTSSQ